MNISTTTLNGRPGVEATEADLNGEDHTRLEDPHPRTRELTDSIPGMLPVDGAAVGIRAGADTAVLIHATDPVAAHLDDLQYTLGEGPALDAYRHRHPVLIPDLTAAAAFTRWPVFAHEATHAGAAAAFAFPLQAGAAAFGTIELYRRTPGPLTAQHTATAQLITAAIVTAVLDDLTGPHPHPTGAPTVIPAFGPREIPQATGMIAAQLGITLPQALAQLRAAAFAANTSVLDIARDVINRRTTLTDDPE